MRLAALLILLAACSKQEPPKIEADVVIRVTEEGTVHWNGERVRLEDVAERLEQDEGDTSVLLDGESEADWAHVQWVLALCKKHRFVPVKLARDGRQPVPVASDFDGWDAVLFGSLRIELDRSDRGSTRFRLGQRSTTRLDQACDWIEESASTLPLGGYIAVEARGDIPFRNVHTVLASIARFGHVRADVGVEPPHFWVRRQDPLPAAEWLIQRWWLSLYKRHDLAPITLPLARAGQEDKDLEPHDRVVVNVDSRGNVLWLGRPISLQTLSANLGDAHRAYCRKCENRGRSGGEIGWGGRTWSKVFILLRADHETPWRHIAPILELLHEQGFYALQFATTRTASLAHSTRDAARVGVERFEGVPSGVPFLARKIYCFLATAHDPSERFIEVEVSVSGRFRIEGADFSGVAQLAAEIKTRYRRFDEIKGVTVKGRILAEPENRYQDVISALDAFGRAGLEKVDLK